MNGGRYFDSDVNDPAYDDFYGPAMRSDTLTDDVVPPDLYSTDIRSPRMREHCENWLARNGIMLLCAVRFRRECVQAPPVSAPRSGGQGDAPEPK